MVSDAPPGHRFSDCTIKPVCMSVHFQDEAMCMRAKVMPPRAPGLLLAPRGRRSSRLPARFIGYDFFVTRCERTVSTSPSRSSPCPGCDYWSARCGRWWQAPSRATSGTWTSSAACGRRPTIPTAGCAPSRRCRGLGCPRAGAAHIRASPHRDHLPLARNRSSRIRRHNPPEIVRAGFS